MLSDPTVQAGLADELGAILARRTEMESEVFQRNDGLAAADSLPGLVARIRHLFEV